MKNFSKILILIVVCSLTFVACKKKETQQIPVGKVTQGTLFIDLYEEGEIEAINSVNIVAPMISWRYGNLKITELVKDGEEVKAGDTLIVFDPSEVLKGIVEAESSLEIAQAEFDKMKAQQQSELEELRAAYEVTRISHEISKIRFESAGYESDIKKKEIQLNLDKAEIALERAEEQIENRIKIQKEEIKQKNLSIMQFQSRLDEARETLQKLSVVTPSSGIAILSKNWSSNNKFQIGDQCWSGFPIIQLPDLSSLKATVKINEVDIAKISKGLKVEIKPDAFSDSVFSGTVNSIANLAVNKDESSKIKVFPVEILLNESDKNLLPGLTVSCRIIMDKVENVLFIPLDALFTEGDISFVYKRKGTGYEKTEIETGINNTDYIVVERGLKKGEEIALVNPFAKETEEKKTENAEI
ncbi:MAG: HlyD family efflux transporter periplasmic adaptor subunit [Proteiniphilum sp.]|nr:HlyD family efflux transporter periplasmic adaptor subunit [Proteiniphilum sp.]MDD3909612.1 HlyD family efflux transporter periplasmic adaptor subunit [Proteiniphilum sp.]MDD4415727.1 HlyD family efflux transporter periplasmic adaptor subunit [Proteiniphilum sp.]